MSDQTTFDDRDLQEPMAAPTSQETASENSHELDGLDGLDALAPSVAMDDSNGGDGADATEGGDVDPRTESVSASGQKESAPRGHDDGAEAGTGPTTGRGNQRVGLLEREGEVAADFLERLLDIADLDGDIEVDIDGDRAAVAIVDSDEGRVPRRLVGSDGKVLDALQELTRLAVQAETGERSRLMLDIAGHRAERRSALVEVARAAIADVRATGDTKALDDMTAFERKIVHDEVAASGLISESEGVEPRRHIVILPG